MSIEIKCPSCGKETFLKREPVYTGLKKTGEELSCAACGFHFASEEDVPFREQAAGPKIFTDADRSEKVQVFSESEGGRLCRYCADYVVNPFMQYCARHKREVQATDSCPEFSHAAEKAPIRKPLF
jgi:ribosomal protein S27E